MLKEDNAGIRSSKQDPMQGIRMREQYHCRTFPHLSKISLPAAIHCGALGHLCTRRECWSRI